MSGIFAFVGHSFSEADKQVVGEFLDFFDTLKKSGNLHIWEHAEDAEALNISEKVKDKLRGKNLFIGICTRRERVVQETNLFKIPFDYLIGKERNFEWKASDWILQELGFSLGLGLRVILLVENGIKNINGLHGDLEFIPFDRQNTSLSFTKVIQQLESVEPDKFISKEQSEDSAKSSKPDSDEKDANKSYGIDYTLPLSSWKFYDFIWAMHFAIWDKNLQLENNINDKCVDVFRNDSNRLLDWESEYLLMKQKLKSESALSQLKTMVIANPENGHLHQVLGKALEHFKDLEGAYDEYTKALTAGEEWNIKYLSSTVECLALYMGNNAAKEFMESNIEKIVKNEQDRFLFIKSYYLLFKDDSPHIYCALIEKALSINPDENSMRFKLAFKYSELKMSKLSLYHYKILTKANSNETNWNNLGVEYDSINLPLKSIEAYRSSESMGGTLAMSNIANRFLNAGFEKEAREITRKALEIEGYDYRVPISVNLINEKLDSEEKQLATLDIDIKSDQTFLLDYAHKLVMPQIKYLSGICKSSVCDLEVSITGGEFTMFGVFEKEVPLAGLLGLGKYLASGTTATSTKTNTHKISYKGIVKGYAGTFEVSRETLNQDGLSITTVLGAMGATGSGIFYFDDSKNEFVLMEFSSSGQPSKEYKMEFHQNAPVS